MAGKRWLLLLVSSLAALIGASCATPTDRPYIRSITADPLVATKGKAVRFTVSYSSQEQQSFSETEVAVRYSEYLGFEQNAYPLPDEINDQQRELVWKLGTLGKGQSGSLWVEFRLAAQIPREVYELQVAGEISGVGANGSRVGHQRTGKALIYGHPTPTPRPTSPPPPSTP